MSLPASNLRRWAPDLLVVVLLGLVVMWLVRALMLQLPLELYQLPGGDAWFGADTPRTLANMVDSQSDHYRTKVHPVSSILMHSVTVALRAIWGGTDVEAGMRTVKLGAVLWAIGFYVLGRLTGAGRAGSLCFTVLALASAAFQFWFSLVETFFAGSITLLVVLLVAAVAVHRRVGDRWLFVASMVSLSITVTNWAAGLALTIVQRPWRRALGISTAVLLSVAVLALIQRALYRNALLFFLGSREEIHYINQAGGGSLGDRLLAMLWYPVRLPALRVQVDLPPKLDALSVQMSGAGLDDWTAWVAIVLWTVLLAAGVAGLVRTPRWQPFAKVLGLTLAAQVMLHLVYGEETFLYAAHFLPLLMAVVLFARHSVLGRAAPVLALLTAGLIGFHNFGMHAAAAHRLMQGATLP